MSDATPAQAFQKRSWTPPADTLGKLTNAAHQLGMERGYSDGYADGVDAGRAEGAHTIKEQGATILQMRCELKKRDVEIADLRDIVDRLIRDKKNAAAAISQRGNL